MHDGGDAPTTGELGRRMNALEQDVEELRELVDGQESWSHRRRLHSLEDDKRAAELVRQALIELRGAQDTAAEAARNLRRSKWGIAAQWASVLVAAIAVAFAVYLKLHGAS